jgi:hypothetical protein
MSNILDNWRLVDANETITLSDDFAYWLNPNSNVREVRRNIRGEWVLSDNKTIWDVMDTKGGLILKSGWLNFCPSSNYDYVLYSHPGFMDKRWRFTGFHPENFVTPSDEVLWASYSDYVNRASFLTSSNRRTTIKKRLVEKEEKKAA